MELTLTKEHMERAKEARMSTDPFDCDTQCVVAQMLTEAGIDFKAVGMTSIRVEDFQEDLQQTEFIEPVRFQLPAQVHPVIRHYMAGRWELASELLPITFEIDGIEDYKC